MINYIFTNYIFKDSTHPQKVTIAADSTTEAVQIFKKSYNLDIIASIQTDLNQTVFDARFNDINRFVTPD